MGNAASFTDDDALESFNTGITGGTATTAQDKKKIKSSYSGGRKNSENERYIQDDDRDPPVALSYEQDNAASFGNIEQSLSTIERVRSSYLHLFNSLNDDDETSAREDVSFPSTSQYSSDNESNQRYEIIDADEEFSQHRHQSQDDEELNTARKRSTSMREIVKSSPKSMDRYQKRQPPFPRDEDYYMFGEPGEVPIVPATIRTPKSSYSQRHEISQLTATPVRRQSPSRSVRTYSDLRRQRKESPNRSVRTLDDHRGRRSLRKDPNRDEREEWNDNEIRSRLDKVRGTPRHTRHSIEDDFHEGAIQTTEVNESPAEKNYDRTTDPNSIRFLREADSWNKDSIQKRLDELRATSSKSSFLLDHAENRLRGCEGLSIEAIHQRLDEMKELERTASVDRPSLHREENHIDKMGLEELRLLKSMSMDTAASKQSVSSNHKATKKMAVTRDIQESHNRKLKQLDKGRKHNRAKKSEPGIPLKPNRTALIENGSEDNFLEDDICLQEEDNFLEDFARIVGRMTDTMTDVTVSSPCDFIGKYQHPTIEVGEKTVDEVRSTLSNDDTRSIVSARKKVMEMSSTLSAGGFLHPGESTVLNENYGRIPSVDSFVSNSDLQSLIGEDKELDVSFIQKYAGLFEHFLTDNMNLMHENPDLMSYFYVIKLTKIMEASDELENAVKESIPMLKREKESVPAMFQSNLIDAAKQKVQTGLRQEQELHICREATRVMEGKLKWQLLMKNTSRAKREIEILQRLWDSPFNAKNPLVSMPAFSELQPIRDAIAVPAAEHDLGDEQRRQLRQFQMDNAFLSAEVTVLERKLCHHKRIANQNLWVDSVFRRMGTTEFAKFKAYYEAKLNFEKLALPAI